MSRNDSSSYLTGVIVGGVVGACTALLCAPKPGAALTALRRRRNDPAMQARVDAEIDQSFPASDPPSWTSSTGSTAEGERDR
jgi:gas vesicle protein